MTDEELIEALRSIDHMNVDDCFLQSHLYSKAADRIEALLNQQDSIREAALREAAAVAEALAVKWWKEYKDRLSPHCADPHWQGMSDGADDVATAILELIGEKK